MIIYPKRVTELLQSHFGNDGAVMEALDLNSLPTIDIPIWKSAEWNTINWAPHAGQTRAVHLIDTHRFTWICCGRRWGKSDLLAKGVIWPELMRTEDTIIDPRQWPPKILIITPLFDTAQIIFGKVKDLVDRYQVPYKKSRDSTQRMEFITSWGAVLRCMTAKSPKLIAGHDWNLAVADEAADIDNPKHIFEERLFPGLADRQGRFVGIGTPGSPGTLDYEWMLRGKSEDNPDWAFYNGTSMENWFIPWMAKEIEMHLINGVAPEIILRQYFGQYVARSGLVYPEFNKCIQDFRKVNLRNATWYRTMDWGWSNFFVCLIIAKQGDTLYIVDEYVVRQRNLEMIARDLKKMDLRYRFDFNLYDPAHPEHIDFFANWRKDPEKPQSKIRGSWVHYEKPKIEERIDLARRLMTYNQVRCHPRCEYTIKEAGLYRYPESNEKKQERNVSEIPIDKYNHALDCFGYLCDYLFGDIIGSDLPFIPGDSRESERIMEGYPV